MITPIRPVVHRVLRNRVSKLRYLDIFRTSSIAKAFAVLYFLTCIAVVFNFTNKHSNHKLSSLYQAVWEGKRCLLYVEPSLGGHSRGGRRIPVDKSDDADIEDIERRVVAGWNITAGGLWSPSACVPNYRVAIIVPYRNRLRNLKIFVRHMHPFLVRQQIAYGIFVIEPLANVTFNRGLLLNIGFAQAINMSAPTSRWDCFIFHDVDLIPEDDRNIYACPRQPRHMSSSVSTMDYRLPYDAIFGGVSALTRQQVININGYSNLYFGWGGEDDDFKSRIENKGYVLSRYPIDIGRYYMASHAKDKDLNQNRHTLLERWKERCERDGLRTLAYRLVAITKRPLFTHILVDYDENAMLNQFFLFYPNRTIV